LTLKPVRCSAVSKQSKISIYVLVIVLAIAIMIFAGCTDSKPVAGKENTHIQSPQTAEKSIATEQAKKGEPLVNLQEFLIEAVANSDEFQVFEELSGENMAGKLKLRKSVKEGTLGFEDVKEAFLNEIKYRKTKRDSALAAYEWRIVFLKDEEKLCEFGYCPLDGRAIYDDTKTQQYIFFFLPENIIEILK